MLAQSGVDDEVAQKGAQLLLSFQSIQNQVGEGNDIFDRALVAAQDLSVRGYGDLTATSKLLGIALEQPELGFTKLRRAGVLLTEDQKSTIRTLEQTGDHLGAQALLLDIVEAKVGGAGKAYGDSLPGQMVKAQESLKNTEAALIGGAAPAFELLSTAALTASQAVQELPEPLRNTIAIAGLAGTAVFGLIQPLSGLLHLRATLANTSALASATEAAATSSVTVANTAATVSYGGLSTATFVQTGANQALAAGSLVAAEATTAQTTATLGLRAATVAATSVPLLATLSASAAATGPLAIGLAAVATVVGILASDLFLGAESSEDFTSASKTLHETLTSLAPDESATAGVRTFVKSLSDANAELSTGGRGGVSFADLSKETGAGVDELTFRLSQGGGEVSKWSHALFDSGQISERTMFALADMSAEVQKNAKSALDAKLRNGELTQSQYDFLAAANLATGVVDTNGNAVTNWVLALQGAPPVVQANVEASFSLADAIGGDAEAYEEALQRLNEYTDALHASIDPLFGMVDATQDLEDAQRAANEASAVLLISQVAYNNAVKDHGPNSKEAEQALRDLEKAERDKTDADEDAVKSAQGLTDAALALQQQVTLHPETWERATSQIKSWQEQGLITEDQAAQMTWQMELARQKGVELAGTQVHMILDANTGPFEMKIAAAAKLAADIRAAAERGDDTQAIIDRYFERGAVGGGIGYAAGGDVLPYQSFVASDAGGVELALLPSGRYRAGAGGATIVSASQTSRFLHNIEQTVAAVAGGTRDGVVAWQPPVDQSISMRIDKLVTPEPTMSAVVLGRSLRGMRHRMTRNRT